MTAPGHREESIAANGARWFTMAFLVVGILNYGYALLLTRLLDVGAYSRFAAGQGLLLWAGSMAAVSVPWVLAQALARARSDAERYAATRFAMIASAGSGVIAAMVVGIIATWFAGWLSTLALALSTFVIFLGTTTVGWLQGHQRMRALSALIVGENLLKVAAGLLLVTFAGLGDTGAIAAFGIGGLLLLLWWPSVPRASVRRWRTALANRDLWHRALGITAVQALVNLLAVIDVVLVATLPAERATIASYQASAALSRVPLFVASAVGTAFFPSLSRRAASGGTLAAGAVRMYAMVALPLTAILLTMPAPVLAAVFPAQYGPMATLLKFTAIAGLAAGGVSLVTTFFQATGDYSCLWWQGGGLIVYVTALLAGWRFEGITGLAVGAALGGAVACALLSYHLTRRLGLGVLARVPLAVPLLAAGVLILLRPHPVLWLTAATVVGLGAAVGFLRRPRSMGRPDLDRTEPEQRREAMRSFKDHPTVSLLQDAVWRGIARDATYAELQRAAGLARRNQVEGRLARVYPRQLAHMLAEVRVANELFARNLGQVTGRLQQARIPAVLIKADLPGDYVYTNFDLVVPADEWDGVYSALAGWYVHRSTYWLERSSKTLLYPPVGPALHLHNCVSWFDIPVVPTDKLLAGASANGDGCLTPAPADHLRIWLAHALFQNLALDMSELLAIRDLLSPEVIEAGRDEASREGWRAGFDGALATACAAIDRLEDGVPLSLPVPLPAALSLRAGAGHAYYLHRLGQPRVAAREAMLRVPLIVAKRRRMLTG